MQSDSRGDTLKRITKAALGGLAGCALVLGGTQAASGALSEILRIHEDDLADLLMEPTAGPLDSAKATITISQGHETTPHSPSV